MEKKDELLKTDNHFTNIIIGAGAAGLMCAAELKNKNQSTLLIEHNDKPGKKIIISGGGRCNFTNINTSAIDFYSEDTAFFKYALKNYTADDFLKLVKKHKIPYYEKKLGQLFCKNKSHDILNMLLRECHESKVKIKISTQTNEITKEDNLFIVKTNKGIFKSSNLVIASGGLSVKPLGATDFGYRIATQFGHEITNLFPALVPFTIPHLSALAGVSMPVKIKVAGHEISDDLLFTHKGLSGPVILKASLFWNPGDSISISFVKNPHDLIKGRDIKKNFYSVLPKKMVNFWFEHILLLDKFNAGELDNSTTQKIIDSFIAWTVIPSGTEGYKKAEVTRGGVSTTDLSNKTMESKLIDRLFFIGEVVDVTGLLGGYNFQWCWSSATLAARAISKL